MLWLNAEEEGWDTSQASDDLVASLLPVKTSTMNLSKLRNVYNVYIIIVFIPFNWLVRVGPSKEKFPKTDIPKNSYIKPNRLFQIALWQSMLP